MVLGLTAGSLPFLCNLKKKTQAGCTVKELKSSWHLNFFMLT